MRRPHARGPMPAYWGRRGSSGPPPGNEARREHFPAICRGPATEALPVCVRYRHDHATSANQRQERALREKELRIALVCSGGVSLAVYMHGMTKEILKLVRASSAPPPDRRSQRPRQGLVPRRSRARPPRIRYRGGLFRSLARDRPHVGAAGRGRRHRGRLRRRHQRHDAGARAQPRPAHGIAARPVARQRRCLGSAGARRAGGKLEQVVHQAADLGGRGDRHAAGGPGFRGAPEALPVRAIALVQAAARRAPHGGLDVRRGHRDGPRASGGIAAAVRAHLGPVRDAHRLLRLSAAGSDPRSSAHP